MFGRKETHHTSRGSNLLSLGLPKETGAAQPWAFQRVCIHLRWKRKKTKSREKLAQSAYRQRVPKDCDCRPFCNTGNSLVLGIHTTQYTYYGRCHDSRIGTLAKPKPFKPQRMGKVHQFVTSKHAVGYLALSLWPSLRGVLCTCTM